MAAKLGTVGEYVYLCDLSFYSNVMLDSLCEPVCWRPLVVLTVLTGF